MPADNQAAASGEAVKAVADARVSPSQHEGRRRSSRRRMRPSSLELASKQGRVPDRQPQMSAENGHNTGSRRTQRRDLVLAGLVALGLMAMFVAVQRGKVTTYDSKIALATARAITDGHLHLTRPTTTLDATCPTPITASGCPW